MKWKKHRLLLPPEATQEGDALSLAGEAHSYLSRVLRLREGESLELFDGRGQVCRATLVQSSQKLTRLSLEAWTAGLPAPPPLTLMQGVMKGDKMDLVVQKAVELGVTRILPVACVRSVTRFSKDGAEKKVARWQKIANEAARQSGRADLAEVEVPRPLGATLALLGPKKNEEARYLPWEEQEGLGLRSLLFEGPKVSSHVIFIGPEGGLEAAEVAASEEVGFQAISLGGRILRTETAGLAVIAAIRASQGELGN